MLSPPFDRSSTPLAVAAAFLACWAGSPWGAATAAHGGLTGHERCGCEVELRKLVELQEAVDWFRWALLLAIVAAALLAVGLALLASCLLGCCAGRCRRRRATSPVSRLQRAAVSPSRNDGSVLAVLAAAEVRK